MNHYYIEFMLKEQQRQVLEESKRTQMLRAGRDPGAGSLRMIILPFLKAMCANGIRNMRRCRLYSKSILPNNDICSTK